MMQGFGVNTFTLVNANGERHFVKFHWIPELGVHSLMWDECLKISGQDPGMLMSGIILRRLISMKISIVRISTRPSKTGYIQSGLSLSKSLKRSANMISISTSLMRPKFGLRN
jgi:hypothetical protein